MATEQKLFKRTPFSIDCMEEQARFVGIDNTFTHFEDEACYVLETDGGGGPDIKFCQVPVTGAGYPGGAWSEQIQEQWVKNIQQAADNAGMKWIVEAAFVSTANPSSTAGGGGLPGPLTSNISEEFVANGMAARFVQITVCPGSPIPTRLQRTSSTRFSAAVAMRDLLITPVQLGPFREFRICERCNKDGIETDWYVRNDTPEEDQDRLEPFSWDKITDANDIPKCAVPCGTLAQSPSPTKPSCQVQTQPGCDNGNVIGQADDGSDICLEVTRIYQYCEGEITVSHTTLVDDGDGGQIPEEYTMLGDLVDCDTKEAVEEPPVPCEEMISVGSLWKLKNPEDEGVQLDYWQPAALGGTAVDHGDVTDIFGDDLDSHPNPPSHSGVLPTPSFSTASAGNLALLVPNDEAFEVLTGRTQTAGTDQIKMSGFMCGPGEFELVDVNGNTGERGAVEINNTIVVEDTTDSIAGDATAFPATIIPGGLSQFCIATSDLSAWQGVAPSGAAEVFFFTKRPIWECIPVFKCLDTGVLVDCNKAAVEVGEKDFWCSPPEQPASASSGSDLTDEEFACLIGEKVAEALMVEKPEEVSGGSFNVEFKSSGLDSITTDKGVITIEPPDNDGFDTTGADPSTWAGAQSQIQAFLDANGGGTATLSVSGSLLNIDITGTTCEFQTATDDSNPGPHSFTKA